MSTMRIFYLWLVWKLLRWPSIVLIDHDGEMNARLVRGTNSHPIALRFGFGIATARLLSGGATSGPCYVRTWEPLFPSTESK